MPLNINDLLPHNEYELYEAIMDNVANRIRGAMPGIIQAFDPTTQTVSVQPALRERVRQPDLTTRWVAIPVLHDVPLVLPRAGGFVLTFPVQPGDECLLVFADMAIDGWWEAGGVQNQVEKRRHDLSDAFAILGTWSQPRVIAGYATDAARLQTDDGTSYISLKPGEIDLVAATVKANGTVIG